MAAANEFVEDNFFRATRHANRARLLEHLLSPQIASLIPSLFQKPPTLKAVVNQGWVNFTFLVYSDSETPSSYILRVAPRRKEPTHQSSKSVPAFEKERFILERMRGHSFVSELPESASGIVTLDIPGEGPAEFGYLVQSYLPFEPATKPLTARDRAEILRQLGAIAREIHSVKAAGFGTDFDEKAASLSCATFDAFVDSKIASVEAAAIAPQFKYWLNSRLEALKRLDPEPRIFHQDLLANRGNFLLDSSRTVRGVVDWEFAGAGAAFHFELASLVYVLTRDGHPADLIEHDVESVLVGYGMTQAEYRQHYQQDVETIVLLHCVSALTKCDQLMRSGGLEREPWRKLFAERALRVCHRSFRD